MKKIYFLSFILLGFIIQSQAQTKLIAHKSHSGSLNHFKTALEGNLFDMDISNFGGGPLVRMKQRLDSLVRVDDTTVVMHMSTFIVERYDTVAACSIHDREMIFTEYSNVEYEDDALDLLKNNTQFDFPVTETKIIGYKTKGFEDIKVIPSSMPNHISNEKAVKADDKLPGIKKKTTKELRKERRNSKKVGIVKERTKAKVCEKPSLVIPFFKKERIIEEETVVESRKHDWIIMMGLGMISLLLGGLTQYAKG